MVSVASLSKAFLFWLASRVSFSTLRVSSCVFIKTDGGHDPGKVVRVEYILFQLRKLGCFWFEAQTRRVNITREKEGMRYVRKFSVTLWFSGFESDYQAQAFSHSVHKNAYVSWTYLISSFQDQTLC